MAAELYYLNSGARQYGLYPVRVYARDYWEFQAVFSGRIAPVLPSGAGEPVTATLWIFEPGLEHGWTAPGAETAEIAVFHLSPPDPLLQQLVAARGGMLAVPLQRADIRWLQAQREQLAAEWALPTPVTRLKVLQLQTGLALLALERQAGAPRPRGDAGDAGRVERALYWYRQNLGQHPGVPEVAAAVGVSEVHLRRLFRRTGGRSPKAAFQRIRMEHARELLADPSSKVEAVAAALGYGDAASFTRAYRDHFGHAPRRPR